MKPKKPQEPQEFIWVVTKISEKNVYSGNKKDDKTPSEYIEICIEDIYGDSLDGVKIEEYEHRKIQDPNYEKKLGQYKKDLKIYEKYCTKIKEKKKVTKAVKERLINQLQTLDAEQLQEILKKIK